MNTSKTAKTKFIPAFVVERTINVVPHISLRLICGEALVNGESPRRAAIINIKNHAENTGADLVANKHWELAECLKELIDIENTNPPVKTTQRPTVLLQSNSKGISVSTRSGDFLLLSRYNHALGTGKRNLVPAMKEFLGHLTYLFKVRSKWMKGEEIIEDNPGGDITTPHMFVRTVTTFTEQNKIRATSVSAYLTSNKNGDDYVNVCINSGSSNLGLSDKLESFGGRADPYGRPVPVILDRLAEGLAVLLANPDKTATINAQPDKGQFEGWDDTNAYVSSTNSDYVFMNCDGFPACSKVGWHFSDIHLQGVYEAMRDLLTHYPHH